MASTVWRGHITFGLISIPVRLFRAARAERVRLRRVVTRERHIRIPTRDGSADTAVSESVPLRLHAQDSRKKRDDENEEAIEPDRGDWVPVQQVSVRSNTKQILNPRELTKGYEYEKGKFVPLRSEELKSLQVKTSTEMAIQEFVRLDEIDPIYFESSYYVVPEEVGEKPYALFYKSLQQARLVAISRVAMHSREHAMAVRAGMKGLVAHTLFYTDEVHGDEEYQTDPSLVSKAELELARTLVNSLQVPFEPHRYQDTYRANLEKLIAGKRAELPKPAKTGTAEVIDISEALRRSLAQLRKPPAASKTTEKSSTRKNGR